MEKVFAGKEDVNMGRQENTKELFLYEALKLFGERGYEAVKISEIAEAVGCTAPALYKHYESKQKLFEAIIEESERGYANSMRAIRVDFSKDEEAKARFANMTVEDQIQGIKKLFLHALHDPWASSFRKLATVEQFRIRKLAQEYNDRYVTALFEQYEKIFRYLMEIGKMKQGDAYTLAMAYISPITLMIGVCDREPDKEDWALEMIEKSIRQFHESYRIE
ncbi:MAG: TetR/AcrR family transcriptional regulator [Eubacteriales bacterium]|nr:TetR/AcrR family transcriptional regulator [Lachnospiraceae bacterium]MDO5127993.1 TetR/AcrR family transcriptional regulator [Eubacteriales bacterium]